ncbi:putative RNA helicase [Helianthus anomalus]
MNSLSLLLSPEPALLLLSKSFVKKVFMVTENGRSRRGVKVFATRVKVLVLEESDHLLDMGFCKDVEVRQICHIALKRDHEYINTVEEGSEETHVHGPTKAYDY